jgi:hypothetical protein
VKASGTIFLSVSSASTTAMDNDNKSNNNNKKRRVDIVVVDNVQVSYQQWLNHDEDFLVMQALSDHW